MKYFYEISTQPWLIPIYHDYQYIWLLWQFARANTQYKSLQVIIFHSKWRLPDQMVEWHFKQRAYICHAKHEMKILMVGKFMTKTTLWWVQKHRTKSVSFAKNLHTINFNQKKKEILWHNRYSRSKELTFKNWWDLHPETGGNQTYQRLKSNHSKSILHHTVIFNKHNITNLSKT